MSNNTVSMQDFIAINKIDEGVLYASLHQDILEMYLREICEYIKSNDANLIKIKSIYRRYNDDLMAISVIVRNFGDFIFSDDDLNWLNTCLKCFFKKKSKRTQLSLTQKKELWISQGKHCQFCKKNLSLNEIRVDHIIPWDYVGDELPNNLQILCNKCNSSKSNHVAQEIHNLIFYREEQRKL